MKALDDVLHGISELHNEINHDFETLDNEVMQDHCSDLLTEAVSYTKTALENIRGDSAG